MESQITLQGMTLTCTEDEICVNGQKLDSARMERKLLLYLMRHTDVAMSRERLLREVWGYEAGGTTRTVDTHIKNLRAHLGALGSHIVTVRGVGYRLDTECREPVSPRGPRCPGEGRQAA